MSRYKWFPWFPEDYERDTWMLSELADLAYRRLLDKLYMNGGKLPNSPEVLARAVRFDNDKWHSICHEVASFFLVTPDGFLTHERVTEELQKTDQITNVRSKAGKEGALSRWNKKKMAESADSKPIATDMTQAKANGIANAMANDMREPIANASQMPPTVDNMLLSTSDSTTHKTTTTADDNPVANAIDPERRDADLQDIPDQPKRQSDYFNWIYRKGVFKSTVLQHPDNMKLYEDWRKRGVTLAVLEQAWVEAMEQTGGSISSPKYIHRIIDSIMHKLENPRPTKASRPSGPRHQEQDFAQQDYGEDVVMTGAATHLFED